MIVCWSTHIHESGHGNMKDHNLNNHSVEKQNVITTSSITMYLDPCASKITFFIMVQSWSVPKRFMGCFIYNSLFIYLFIYSYSEPRKIWLLGFSWYIAQTARMDHSKQEHLQVTKPSTITCYTMSLLTKHHNYRLPQPIPCHHYSPRLSPMGRHAI